MAKCTRLVVVPTPAAAAAREMTRIVEAVAAARLEDTVVEGYAAVEPPQETVHTALEVAVAEQPPAIAYIGIAVAGHP